VSALVLPRSISWFESSLTGVTNPTAIKTLTVGIKRLTMCLVKTLRPQIPSKPLNPSLLPVEHLPIWAIALVELLALKPVPKKTITLRRNCRVWGRYFLDAPAAPHGWLPET
jgi:hypothetical protein